MKKYLYKSLQSLKLPVLCTIAGAITGIIIILFRFLVNLLSNISADIFKIIRIKPVYIPLFIAGLVLCAGIICIAIKKAPDIKGGGIPRAEGILRGLITFNWLKVLIGTFVSGIVTFLCGLSLGIEGPSVMLGTATGKGVSKFSPVLSRYIMTGSSAAGFAVATGAPLSGIVFVLEEIHKRFSFFLLAIVMWTVACAFVTASFLASMLDIPLAFLHIKGLITLSLSELWIPILIGIFAGLTATFFNRAMDIVNRFFEIRLKNVTRFIKVLVVIIATALIIFLIPLVFGSGHHIIEDIISGNIAMLSLLLLFAIKIVLITFAANSGATGGLFVPVLVMGAISGGFLSKLTQALGLSLEYAPLIVVMCMCATMGASMHAPITAVVFIIEITGANQNSLFLIICVLVAAMIMHLSKTESINDIMLNKILRQQDGHKKSIIIEHICCIQQDSFLIGKTVRDILLPPNCIIKAYVRKNESANSPKMVKGGDKVFKHGDIVTFQIQTYNESQVKNELNLLFGSIKTS